MNDRSDSPKPYDLVLGGNNPPRGGGMVLGGIEGVKRRLQSDRTEVRIAALKDAIDYGEAGLNLLIDAFQNELPTVVWDIYNYLIDRQDSQIQKIFNEYHPYKRFELLSSLSGGHLSDFDIDCNSIISLQNDWELKFWNIDTGEIEKELELQLTIGLSPNSIAVISNCNKIVTGNADKDLLLLIYDTDTGKLLQNLKGHTAAIIEITLTPDRQKIVSGSVDRSIKVWDINTGKLINTLIGHSSTVYSVAVTPDSQKVISGSVDKTIKIWDIDSGECLKTLLGHGKQVCSVAVTPDNKKIISSSEDKTIKVWDINSGKCLKTLLGHSEAISSIAINPNGTSIVSGSRDKTIKVWDIDLGECLKTLLGNIESVNKVMFADDGQKIVSSSLDMTIKTWGIK